MPGGHGHFADVVQLRRSKQVGPVSLLDTELLGKGQAERDHRGGVGGRAPVVGDQHRGSHPKGPAVSGVRSVASSGHDGETVEADERQGLDPCLGALELIPAPRDSSL